MWSSSPPRVECTGRTGLERRRRALPFSLLIAVTLLGVLVYTASTLFVGMRSRAVTGFAMPDVIVSRRGVRARSIALPAQDAVASSSGLRVTLPYAMSALEGVISAATVDFHYNQHHKGYVQKLVDATGWPESRIDLKSLVALGSARAREAVFNSAGQIYNHNMYWLSMNPPTTLGSRVPARLAELIRARWGTIETMKEEFMRKGTALFGSGWIWLVWDTRTKRLDLVATKDAHSPLSENRGQIPLFTCDVWEHAYYLDYQHDRAAYLRKWWEIINWEFAESNLPKDI